VAYRLPRGPRAPCRLLRGPLRYRLPCGPRHSRLPPAPRGHRLPGLSALHPRYATSRTVSPPAPTSPAAPSSPRIRATYACVSGIGGTQPQRATGAGPAL